MRRKLLFYYYHDMNEKCIEPILKLKHKIKIIKNVLLKYKTIISMKIIDAYNIFVRKFEYVRVFKLIDLYFNLHLA